MSDLPPIIFVDIVYLSGLLFSCLQNMTLFNPIYRLYPYLNTDISYSLYIGLNSVSSRKDICMENMTKKIGGFLGYTAIFPRSEMNIEPAIILR